MKHAELWSLVLKSSRDIILDSTRLGRVPIRVPLLVQITKSKKEKKKKKKKKKVSSEGKKTDLGNNREIKYTPLCSTIERGKEFYG